MMLASQPHSQCQRDRILEAAEILFAACGYADATMAGIAEAAGVAKGSVYNHFGSKHELFVEVFDQVTFGNQERVRDATAAGAPPAEKLRELLRVACALIRIRHHARLDPLVVEFYAIAARETEAGELPARIARVQGRWRERIKSILVEGIERGEFDERIKPAAFASLIQTTLTGLMIQAVLDSGEDIGNGYLTELQEGIMAGLAPRTADAAPDTA